MMDFNPVTIFDERSLGPQIVEQIELEIQVFNDMKKGYAGSRLTKFPDSEEEAIALLKPFRDELEERYQTVFVTFQRYKDICDREHRGQYHHVMGKLCNLFEEHVADALPYFEKAAKFMPNEVNVWNDLGDCHLSLGQLNVARRCFEEALRRAPNSWSFRSLSIVCRREASDNSLEMGPATILGVQYAKEAIKIDATDGYSWMILGNAFMAHFLAVRNKHLMPAKALRAYYQAEKNDGTFPELYFNKAIAYLYAEEYSRALEALEEALRKDPIWSIAWKKYFTIRNYIIEISDFCYTKSKVKQRKISQLIQNLRGEIAAAASSKYTYKTVSELKDGVNVGKIIVGKVLWVCETEESFPVTIGFVDGTSHLIVVTVFNLKTGLGFKIGDTISIVNPNFSNHLCIVGARAYKFVKIRIDSPREVLVNGRALPLLNNVE